MDLIYLIQLLLQASVVLQELKLKVILYSREQAQARAPELVLVF